MKLAAILLALLIPTTASALTLDDFEKPYKGSPESGGVIPFTITPEQADQNRILIYRNHPTRPFNLSVLSPDGTTHFEKAGTRGVQNLPGLPAGDYRFVITRAPGEFQITTNNLADLAPQTATLQGPADAYVYLAPHRVNLTITGNVTTEDFNLQSSPQTHTGNTTITIEKGQVHILTLTGNQTTPYTITLETLADQNPPPTNNDTPAPTLIATLTIGAILALARRNKR